MLGEYYESIAEFDRAITHLSQEVEGERFDAGSDIDLNSHYLLAIIYSEHRRNASKALHHATAYYEIRQDPASKALRRRAAKLLNSSAENVREDLR